MIAFLYQLYFLERQELVIYRSGILMKIILRIKFVSFHIRLRADACNNYGETEEIHYNDFGQSNMAFLWTVSCIVYDQGAPT